MKLMILALSTVCLAAAATAETAAVKEVTAAMESLKQAMINKDGATLETLLSDELTYTHSAGQEETKAAFIRSIVSGKSIVARLDISNPAVRVYGNTALFKSAVDLYHSKTNIVHMNILHVWVKGPNGWRLVARQATRLNPASH